MTDNRDRPFPGKDREPIGVLAGLGTLVRFLTVVAALVLALGAILVALRDNVSQTNVLVKAILDVAGAIDGPFARENGIFAFTGEDAVTRDAVVNWGIGAIVYLLVGRVINRLLAREA